MANPLTLFRRPTPDKRMRLAGLLRLLAELIGDDEQPEETDDGVKPPATQPFREQGIRTRPDFIPRP
jgi:hypothetical protein